MAKTKQQIRVLLADDHAIFRDGLRKLLDSDEDITIVGEAQNGAECIKLLAKLKPDILLLDLRMPDKDGLAVLEEVNFVAIIFGGGQNNDARRQRIEIDFLKHGQAVFIRHAQIEEQNIRLELGEHLDALRPVLCLADDGNVLVGI